MNILPFLLGGNSTVTFKSKATGNRFTYRIKMRKDKSGKKDENMYFVSLLNGPNNTMDYIYMGSIYATNGGWNFTRTKGSKVSENATSIKAFTYVFNRIKNNIPLNDVEVWHEGKCGVCGRKLTVPESIRTGIGPHCRSYIS